MLSKTKSRFLSGKTLAQHSTVFLLSFFCFLLSTTLCVGQTPVSISYNVEGSINTNGLNPLALAAAPKECIINFNYAAPSVRVVMESPNGQVNYLDRVFALNVHANPDSTYVYGKPGAWTIGLGQFTNVSEFRVKLLDPMAPGLVTAVAQGSYP